MKQHLDCRPWKVIFSTSQRYDIAVNLESMLSMPTTVGY